MMLLIAFLSQAALAATPTTDRVDVSLEIGSLGTDAPQWSMFSDNASIVSGGGRVGVSLTPQAAIIVDYHASHAGSTLWSDGPAAGGSPGADLTLHQLGIGTRLSALPDRTVQPYVTAQALGLSGRLTLMEDVSEDDSAERFTDRSLGGVAALGVALVNRSPQLPVRVSTHLESGYARAFALSFQDRDAGNTPADIGQLTVGGLYVRFGIGVRF